MKCVIQFHCTREDEGREDEKVQGRNLFWCQKRGRHAITWTKERNILGGVALLRLEIYSKVKHNDDDAPASPKKTLVLPTASEHQLYQKINQHTAPWATQNRPYEALSQSFPLSKTHKHTHAT